MAKLKYGVLFLLCAAIVITGAFLPRLVAGARDDATLGKAGYKMMQPVEFEIHRNIPSLGKLAMMENLSGAVEIQTSRASMTEQEVRESCRTQLQPYIGAGLMADYKEWQITTRAHLVQNGQVSGILWTVSILNDAEGLYCINAVVDDETGALLRIDVSDQQFRGSELRTEYLYTLSDLFFSGLGISGYADFETDDPTVFGTSADALHYCFGDVVYGEVNVNMVVSEYGFCVDFPQRGEVTVSGWE